MRLNRIWAAMLWLYPARHRALFGEEMLAVLERRERGAWTEAAGLLAGVVAAWLREPNRPMAAAEPVDEVAAAEARVTVLVGRIVHAIATHQFEAARTLCREEEQAREDLRKCLPH